MVKISKSKIAILATDGFEQSELKVPLDKLRTASALVHVVAPANRKDPACIIGWKDKDWGERVPVDVDVKEAGVGFHDALVLPGGQMNPDTLRQTPEAMTLIKEFVASGKPVAAICHAPWLLIEANAVRGRKATSYKSIKTGMTNAGANWVDEPVVSDEGIVTSRAQTILSNSSPRSSRRSRPANVIALSWRPRVLPAQTEPLQFGPEGL
jgi:protease I